MENKMVKNLNLIGKIIYWFCIIGSIIVIFLSFAIAADEGDLALTYFICGCLCLPASYLAALPYYILANIIEILDENSKTLQQMLLIMKSERGKNKNSDKGISYDESIPEL